MAYELTGKVKLVQEAQTFSSGFTKRAIIVTAGDGKYPQDICIEFVQDRICLLDNIQPGEEVTIAFDIRGREYNGSYYNNLQGWKIQTNAAAPAADKKIPSNSNEAEYEDDIPF